MNTLKILHSNRGFSLIAAAILTSVVLCLAMSTMFLSSNFLQNSASQQKKDLNGDTLNQNAIVLANNLVKSGTLIEDGTTHAWSVSSSAPSSKLWSWQAASSNRLAAVLVNQCNPDSTSLSTTGSVPDVSQCLSTASSISTQVQFVRTLSDGRIQVIANTTYRARAYALSALLNPAPPPPKSCAGVSMYGLCWYATYADYSNCNAACTAHGAKGLPYTIASAQCDTLVQEFILLKFNRAPGSYFYYAGTVDAYKPGIPGCYATVGGKGGANYTYFSGTQDTAANGYTGVSPTTISYFTGTVCSCTY